MDYSSIINIDSLHNYENLSECRDKCIRFFNNIYSSHYALESLKGKKDNS